MQIRWRILLFGELRAEGEDGRVVARFSRQKSGALLAYLAYHLRRTHPRDELVELLWPDSDLQAGRNSLNVTLTYLRRDLEPTGVPAGTVLVADRATVRLNPDSVTTDVAEFEAALGAAERAGSAREQLEHLARAVELYRGELLPEYSEPWLPGPRQWLSERYFRALHELLALLEQAGEVDRALDHARRGVERDPLREEAHQDVMRLWGAAGNPEAGLRQYRELQRVLKEDLGITPSAATETLARALRSQQEAARRGAGEAEGASATRAGAGPSLPTGTVTFMLTDIESSARLWEQHSVAMPLAVSRHDALLTREIERHGGIVLKSRLEGDSFFAVFPRATQAVAAACALQRAAVAEPWPGGIPLRVRAALHTGEAHLRAGDYFGAPINRCARLRALAHGGQTLLSRATYQIVCEELPEGVSLRDLGAHRLRDLERPEQLFQLLHPDLPADFPPPSSAVAPPHNLRRPLDRFVDREEELAEVRRLLETTLLLTLTGAGGCGKTRLAVQAGYRLVEEYPDGVWLVELAALTDPALVLRALATTLQVREEPGRPLLETLTDALRPKSLLLILDNCEHLVDACRALAGALLESCPGLRVMATSREVLALPGETVYRVPPLPIPTPEMQPAVEGVRQYAAVELFVDRAQSSQPRFAVSSGNAAAVAEICRRLDGIPLALELAAAQVRLLSAEQIRARLADRFRLLTRGNPMALPHQQTLQATMDWSYELLSEGERRLLCWLSVFAGGWSLEAAEAVCVGEEADELDVFLLLGQLVDKSLVVVEEHGDEVRYRLLETIRQYSEEKLRGAREQSALRARHREWFLALAERAEPELTGPDQAAWLDRLEAEHDNLRAALGWSVESGAAGAGLRLGGALWRFWYVRGHWTEGRERLMGLLDLPEAQPRTAARAKALNGAGMLAYRQGDYAAARAFHEESLAIRREAGDRRGLAASLHNLGRMADTQGDYTPARLYLEESLAIWRELGDERGIATLLHSLGNDAYYQGDCDAARPLFEESLAIKRKLKDQQGIANSLNMLGNVAELQGDYAAARSLLEESLAVSRALGDKGSIANALANLGNIAFRQDDYAAAGAHYEESLTLRQALGDKQGIALSCCNLGEVARAQGEWSRAASRYASSLALFHELGDRACIAACLEGLAAVAAAPGREEPGSGGPEGSDAGGRAERAARLFGAAAALREAIRVPLAPAERADCERHLAAARARLGEEAFAAAWAAGRTMTLEEAITFASSGADLP